MKKADWIIVVFFVVMGLSCLFVSASSFQGVSLVQMGASIGQTCLFMMVAAVIIGVIYWLTQRKKP